VKTWYFWWIARSDRGEWFGPLELSDEEVWRFEYDAQRGTPGILRMYRWLWDGQNWQYDNRSATALYVRAGEQRLASSYFP
jgi:hypothetical protein